MNEDEYPDEIDLDRIRNWDWKDPIGWMELVVDIWHWPDWGYKKVKDTYYLHTGGWSGNEEIIRAMMGNQTLWALMWQSSERGGHYVFHDIRYEL